MDLEPVADVPAIVMRGAEEWVVVEDLHVGIEVQLRRSGFTIPTQMPKMMASLEALASGPRNLLILGDLKHRIRAILSDPKNFPYRRVINVAPRKLDLSVNIVMEGNDIAGYIANWEGVTDREHAQAEALRLKNMMDNVNINVMLADRDLTLVYMNPASQRTLKSLERLLAVPVDKMIGQKIDIFHKRPEYQRQLLADDSQIPRKANINLGQETLSLNVVPIYDQNKQYIGPMVTWELITDRVKLAQDASWT